MTRFHTSLAGAYPPVLVVIAHPCARHIAITVI